MGAARQAGPTCTQNNPTNINDGTLCRAQSPAPTPSGWAWVSSEVSSAASSVSRAYHSAVDNVSGDYAATRDKLRAMYHSAGKYVRSDYEGARCIVQAVYRGIELSPVAVYQETGYQLGNLLKGLLPGLVQMLAVLGVTTFLGATIGGIVGFFFGGAGAAPGLVVGGDLGFDLGMAALTWLGVAVLAVSIADGFADLLYALKEGVQTAWAARNLSGRAEEHQVDHAADCFASCVAILFRLILQGILAYLLKKAAVKATRSAMTTARMANSQGAAGIAEADVAELVGRLRNSRLGSGFADWVEKNWRDLADNPKLKPKATTTSGGAAATAAGEQPPAPQPGGSGSSDDPSSGGTNQPAAATPARLPQDAAVNPNPPPALPLNRPVGLSPAQNAQVQADIAAARAEGATDFRVNQQQVDAAGNRVGVNRPDLQYTDANGQRVYIEYDTPQSGRGPAHETRIMSNDPDGQVILKVIP